MAFQLEQLMLLFVSTGIAGVVPTFSSCKLLNPELRAVHWCVMPASGRPIAALMWAVGVAQECSANARQWRRRSNCRRRKRSRTYLASELV